MNYQPYPYYQPYTPTMMQNTPTLPAQQIIQVNGKSSVDTIQLAPNSSVLVMDTSAPIVWMCVSDGIGKVTATPYDITVHKDKPTVDVSNIEQRLSAVEKSLTKVEGKLDEYKSNVSKSKPKQNGTNTISD